ncbi:hypothetical protein B0T21DRAFT_425799 [Apiosordaria backusii]|uniref:Uncharacterized protein n=1 Tax=Apiosordaria backusii TaxID=314023 RepID=A0AA40DUZ8_9PEZI|nr:hypothetical protein B0T21DRAFT_425799 [Apiosordaria backusii]
MDPIMGAQHPNGMATQGMRQYSQTRQSHTNRPLRVISDGKDYGASAARQTFTTHEKVTARDEHHDKRFKPRADKAHQKADDDKENDTSEQHHHGRRNLNNLSSIESLHIHLDLSSPSPSQGHSMSSQPDTTEAAGQTTNHDFGQGASKSTSNTSQVSSSTMGKASDESLRFITDDVHSTDIDEGDSSASMIQHPRTAPHHYLAPKKSCIKRKAISKSASSAHHFSMKKKVHGLHSSRYQSSTTSNQKQLEQGQARHAIAFNETAICLTTGEPYEAHQRGGLHRQKKITMPQGNQTTSTEESSPPRNRFEQKIGSRLERASKYKEAYKRGYLAKLDKYKQGYKAAIDKLTGDEYDTVMAEMPLMNNYMRRCTMAWAVLRYKERVKTEGQKLREGV